MTEAEKAYAKAQNAISKVKARNLSTLDLSENMGRSFLHLERLPPEISDLPSLRNLRLKGTKISDISVLQGLTGLTSLNLSGTQIMDISVLRRLTGLKLLDLSDTQISDISVLQGLTGLTSLFLTNTQISDISVLQGLTGLTSLTLSKTQISDISVLQGLTGLTSLFLTKTQISDISVLNDLTGLTSLDLSGTQISDTDLALLSTLQNLTNLSLFDTQVLDLAPLRALQRLHVNAGRLSWDGLHFKNTIATRLDLRIAEIAEIEDNAERARVLFDYLKDWVPPPQPSDMPAPEPTGFRYGVVMGGRLGYDMTPSKVALGPDMDQLHGLLCDDTEDMLRRFPLGKGADYETLGLKLGRYQGALGASAASIMSIPMWKAGNDLRVLLRANRDRIGNSLGEMPYFGADLAAAVEGLVATHNIFSARHPDLSALDLAQIDPVDRARAEANRALMEDFIEAMAHETRIILGYVVQDLRDLHSEALLANDAGARALKIEEDSLRNMILEIVTQALIEQRRQSGVVTVLKDARAGLVGAGAVIVAPEIAAHYPQLAATIQPYLGTLLAGWHGKEFPVKQAVEWIVGKVKNDGRNKPKR